MIKISHWAMKDDIIGDLNFDFKDSGLNNNARLSANYSLTIGQVVTNFISKPISPLQ